MRKLIKGVNDLASQFPKKHLNGLIKTRLFIRTLQQAGVSISINLSQDREEIRHIYDIWKSSNE